jgi:hypothetical protein
LTETDVGQFRFGAQTLSWRDRGWPIELLRHVRQRAIAFGSCSFEEPVDDLNAMGLLSIA